MALADGEAQRVENPARQAETRQTVCEGPTPATKARGPQRVGVRRTRDSTYNFQQS